MFNLFKKKTPDIQVASPVKGKVIPLEEAKDDVFSQKMMGDGFAVIPTEGVLLAPVDAMIKSIFPTKHAMELDADGVSVLLHFGVDTVNLKGKPFDLKVETGESIQKGQTLGSYDLEYLAARNVDSTVFTVFPDLPDGISLVHEVKEGQVSNQDTVIIVHR